MGVTITVAIGFWLASSYLEYRVICALPWSKPIFDHAVGGIAISLLIGYCASLIFGIPAGIGVTLGQLAGVATNKLTYEMYSGGAKALKYTELQYHKTKAYYQRNRERVQYAANTIRLGIKGLGAMTLGFLWVVGLPFRIHEWYQRKQVN